MKKRWMKVLCAAMLAGTVLAGCGDSSNSHAAATTSAETAVQSEEITEAENADTASVEDSEDTEEAGVESELIEETGEAVLEDGIYTVDFDTDSSMFHVNEAYKGTATLTVEDGAMTVHITLQSTNIVNLYPGTAAEAQEADAVLLEPTLDEVTYSDGLTEEVYGFDVPVPYIDEEFDLALIGRKGKWYDHKVSVSNPIPAESE